MTSSPKLPKPMLGLMLCLVLSLTAGCVTQTGSSRVVAKVIAAQCFTDAQLATMSRAQKVAAAKNNAAAGKTCN